MTDVEFDDRRATSLDGEWEFYPGDHKLDDLDRLAAKSIGVPGLWEAQDHLDLDGVAWYRRRFAVDDVSGGWTLRFGAVMDMAEVFLNGTRLGEHEQAFTPFEFDVAGVLRVAENELAVRVVDPALGDEAHVRMAHGKQGWANHVFPSRPSLYMTYGGIWQPVTLRRHGDVVLTDAFVNGDPEDLLVTATVENRGGETRARVGIRTLGTQAERGVDVEPGATATVEARLGRTTAARWRPHDPVLHELLVDVWTAGSLSDSRAVRYGLRRVTVDGRGLRIDGVPLRMKSVLVQGFRGDTLYAEGTRAQIEDAVRAARNMGFNTLRLHIKAFDPTYLDVCDEIGMFLHCDIPVAEPIAHEEMGDGTVLTRRSVAAAREQVRRDRSHPSIVLWSAMNEIADGRREARRWPQYESFARTLYDTIRAEDPTRPVIENDWIEPDPEQVFQSPILTAHWYGRLHRDYLEKIEAASSRWAGAGRPLFVSEFGDWGLPDMPRLAEPPFWDTRAVHAAGLADTLWPASINRFAWESQRYQGLSDRLQAEVFRRHDHILGYCLTELTDVPFELNGVLDLLRRPKRLAVDELTRANQVVLPMLRLDTLVVAIGDVVRAPVWIANDGPVVPGATLEARFGDSASAVGLDALLEVDASDLPVEQIEDRFGEAVCDLAVGDIPAHAVQRWGEVACTAPAVPGRHDLVLRLRSDGAPVSENRYPIHVVRADPADLPVRFVGDRSSAWALQAVGATVGGDGPLVVGERSLDDVSGTLARAALDNGEVVLVLAQTPEAAEHYPVPTTLEPLATAWGSTVFRFTTDHGALPSLPRRNLLVGEDSTIHSQSAVGTVEGRPFPDTPVVIAYKPVPGALTGTVVGSHAVGAGRLVYCQYRLAAAAEAGDAAARAILADLVRWAARPRAVMAKAVSLKGDGRTLTAYSWHTDVAR